MPAIELGSYDWHSNVAEIINSIGDRRFPVTLISALERLVAFEHLAIMLFRGDERPSDLLAPHIDAQFHRNYFAGNYRHDPFYLATRRRAAGGLFRMRDLASDHSRYLDAYQLGPRIADLVDAEPKAVAGDQRSGADLREEISFLVPLADHSMAHLALIRSKRQQAFSDHELARLHTIEPVVRTAMQRHWHTAGELPARDLTRREHQIAGEILRGYTTTAIAMRLGISTGTVKVHRKHLYRKLGISSQAELFTRFSRPIADAPWR